MIVPVQTCKLDEKARLKTFEGYWSFHQARPEELAKAGFYCLRSRDKVKCAYCDGVAGEFEYGDDPLIEHVKHFPHCQFARDLQYLIIKAKQSRTCEHRECKVCFEQDSQVVFLPCAHLISCLK